MPTRQKTLYQMALFCHPIQWGVKINVDMAGTWRVHGQCGQWETGIWA